MRSDSVGANHKSEWSKLPFLGCDGVPQNGQQFVDQGRLAATVVIPPSSGPAVDIIATHLRTGAAPAARLVLKPSPYSHK